MTARKTSDSRPRAPHQVRIIGGQWKRTPLAVPDAEGLRPTPDRVRETVFNWINHLLDGTWQHVRCLDLFAGTGALGFEAASRGATHVTMVESNPAAVRQLQAIKAKLNAGQIDIVRGDAMSVGELLARQAGQAGKGFTFIFLDPPYHQQWIAKLLPLCERLLAPEGWLYAEAEMPLDEAALPGWEIVRADKAGMVFYHLLRRKSSSAFEA